MLSSFRYCVLYCSLVIYFPYIPKVAFSILLFSLFCLYDLMSPCSTVIEVVLTLATIPKPMSLLGPLMSLTVTFFIYIMFYCFSAHWISYILGYETWITKLAVSRFHVTGVCLHLVIPTILFQCFVHRTPLCFHQCLMQAFNSASVSILQSEGHVL